MWVPVGARAQLAKLMRVNTGDVSQTGEAVLAGLAIAFVVLLVVVALYIARQASLRTVPSGHVENASDYNQLQIIVEAGDQEAELEVQTDAFETFEQLRELVVDSIPEMFRDTDELTCAAAHRRSSAHPHPSLCHALAQRSPGPATAGWSSSTRGTSGSA